MSVLDAVKKYIRLPSTQVREVEGDSLHASQMENSVALLLPPWSADAIVVLQRLVEVLEEFPSVDLVLVDPATLSPAVVAELELAEPSHGYGEAVWVSHGAIVGMLSRKTLGWERLVYQNTAGLLERE